MVQPSKASAPSGDDESSNSSSENKKKKLELYLKDFDMRGLSHQIVLGFSFVAF